jgi:hypothetical protein
VNHYESQGVSSAQWRRRISVFERFGWPAQKAVLKPPHSRRFATAGPSLDHAKRLECGAFTAAFLIIAANPSVFCLPKNELRPNEGKGIESA